MSVTPETLKIIDTLKQGIEATTGETYNNLTEGVQALKNGYEQGDGEPGKPFIDTSKITDFSYFFSSRERVKLIDLIDTSNGTNFSNAFYNVFQSVIESAPQIDTSKGVYFDSMFQACVGIRNIPLIDIRNGISFSKMFYYCNSLLSLQLTTAKSDLSSNTFQNCTALKNITIGESWEVNIYLHYSNNLTVESLHGMIENLADLTGQTAKTFQIGATNLAKIDEEHISMLNSKNWTYR